MRIQVLYALINLQLIYWIIITSTLYFILKYGNSRLKEKGVEIMGLPAILGLLIVIGGIVCIFYAVPTEK